MTRKVARSSLSNFPPILSPAAAAPPPFLRCGGTYELFPAPRPPGPSGVSAPAAAASPAPSSPTGAMVSLKGHLAVKCSPLQIRHLTFLSFSLSFMEPASVASSLASFLQLELGLKMMFSPTEVVSGAGPALSFSDFPNLAQDLRSATRGFTTSFTSVVRMRRVVLTFFPSSFSLQETVVIVPSLLVVVVSCGSSLEGSSSSSSSAQSFLKICQYLNSSCVEGSRSWCCSLGEVGHFGSFLRRSASYIDGICDGDSPNVSAMNSCPSSWCWWALRGWDRLHSLGSIFLTSQRTSVGQSLAHLFANWNQP